jgi:hypothetical protein
MCFVEAPQGLPPDAKRKLHEELYDAIFEAHHSGHSDIHSCIFSGNAANYGKCSGELRGHSYAVSSECRFAVIAARDL